MPDREEVLFEGRFIEVVRRGPFEFTRNRMSPFVALAIPLTKGNEIVFLEQQRSPLESYVIEYPAGLIGDDEGFEEETAIQAAGRELFEESGYEAGKLEFLFEGPSSPGSSSERVEFYLATDCVKVSQGGGVGHEKIETHAIPLATAFDWLDKKAETGVLVDPRVRLGVYVVKDRLHL